MTFSNNLAILNYHFTFQVYEKVFLAYTLAISLGTLLFSIPNTYAETNLQIFDAFKTATVSSTIFNVIGNNLPVIQTKLNIAVSGVPDTGWVITNKVYSYNTNYAAIQKFIDTRGTIIGDGSTDADWAQVKQKLYDAFELARVDSLASVNAATDSGITNPDSMMAMMGKPFIGTIVDAMSTNLFDFTNYPSQSYNDQPFGWGNKTFDTVDKKSYLLSYVFTHRPYADVPALYAAIIQAKTNIANQNFTNLYTGLQSSLTGSEVMTAISANSPSFQSKMDIIVPGIPDNGYMIFNKVADWRTNYAALNKFVDTKGVLPGIGAVDSDWVVVKQKMYDAFNLARADAVVVINNATNSGTANPDMMMSYMKPFIGDIPDILTGNLFDVVNYPNQTYLNGPLVDGVYGTNDKKSFLLSYVFTHRPYANPAALETALINARTEISNSANSQLYSVLQTATVATDITTAISANITIFQERMGLVVPGVADNSTMITTKVTNWQSNALIMQKFINIRGTLAGSGLTDSDWMIVKQKLYDAFEGARVDALGRINNATGTGIPNPDMMMAMMGKPFIGDIPDALSINLFDIVNYPNLSYGNGAFVDMAFQSTINRQFLLDYVYLSAPYDSVNALYTTMLLARKEALNGTNILPSPNPNKGPVLAPVKPTISDKTGMQNGVVITPIQLPAFTDVNMVVLPLIYQVTGLPSGLSFDANTLTISGTPSVDGSFTIAYIASNGTKSSTTTFLVVIAPVASQVNQNNNPAPTYTPPTPGTILECSPGNSQAGLVCSVSGTLSAATCIEPQNAKGQKVFIYHSTTLPSGEYKLFSYTEGVTNWDGVGLGSVRPASTLSDASALGAILPIRDSIVNSATLGSGKVIFDTFMSGAISDGTLSMGSINSIFSKVSKKTSGGTDLLQFSTKSSLFGDSIKQTLFEYVANKISGHPMEFVTKDCSGNWKAQISVNVVGIIDGDSGTTQFIKDRGDFAKIYK